MSTTLSLKVDKNIKDQAMHIAKELGIPLGTILNAFLRQFIQEKKIEFSISNNHITEQKNDDTAFMQSGASDITDNLPPLSKEEHAYYMNLPQ